MARHIKIVSTGPTTSDVKIFAVFADGTEEDISSCVAVAKWIGGASAPDGLCKLDLEFVPRRLDIRGHYAIFRRLLQEARDEGATDMPVELAVRGRLGAISWVTQEVFTLGEETALVR